ATRFPYATLFRSTPPMARRLRQGDGAAGKVVLGVICSFSMVLVLQQCSGCCHATRNRGRTFPAFRADVKFCEGGAASLRRLGRAGGKEGGDGDESPAGDHRQAARRYGHRDCHNVSSSRKYCKKPVVFTN